MKLVKTMTACAVSALLAACGGGGGSGGSTAPVVTPAPVPAPVVGAAQGFYIGTTSDGREIDTIVLENDQFYTMYGHTTNNAFLVSGFVQGNGKSNNGSFTSADGVDSASNNTRTAASVNATYTAGVNLNGSLVEAASTVNFTSAPIAAAVINYNAPAKLADIAGKWDLTSLRGFATTLNISATGGLSGNSSGCVMSGSIVPRASGKNVFDVSIDFGPAPCLIPSQSIKGIAIDYVATNGQRQLIVAGIDSARVNTAAFFGVR
jgi:hypothetical protein